MIGLAAAVPATDLLAHTPTSTLAMGAGALVGSLLPDADHASAKIHQPTSIERRFWPLGLAALILRVPLRLAALLPHRGPVTHGFPAVAWTLDAAMIAHTELSRTLALLVAGVVVGYLAHLLADGATVSGLPGYPFTHRVHTLPAPLRVTVTRTPSRREHAYAALALLAATVYALTIYTP